ncbi:MAG: glycosyltransferase [Bacteroidia bacterium]|nr:glycosyltransferase [Bacteroidia bacterium]
MNISFLTSGHDPFDDRIFFHMARSLSYNGNNVQVVSSKLDLKDVVDDIILNCFAGDNLYKRKKIIQFVELLSGFTPEIIICSEPLTILAAKQYSKKQSGKIRIIYDITEWYPSKKNLSVHKTPIRWFFFIKLLLFNLLVSKFADSFIFGEWYKSRPYRFFYPRKSFIFTSYYPDLKYISFCNPGLQNGKIRLSYSGKISLEKGYGNFFNVLERLTEYKSDLKIEVKIIGWYESTRDKEECENLIRTASRNITLTILDRQSFKNFIELIKETDIFLDLRSDNFENQHCLPIKLLYYAALGRPVIFSDLIAIRKEVEINKFGFLVNPTDYERIVKLIADYIEDKELYYKHCKNARYLAEKKYNWKKTEPQFLKFITSY